MSSGVESFLLTNRSSTDLAVNGRQLVRRSTGQQLQPKMLARTLQNGGGSILVWGAMTANGVGPLVRLSGTVTGRSYVDMLLQHFVPFAARRLPEDYILQQDRCSKPSQCRLSSLP
jgi:hypothetical protein